MSSKSEQSESKFTQFQALTDLGVECYYIEDFIPKEQADLYLAQLLTDFPFHQEQTTMRIGGQLKTFQQPRLTRFMGDEGTSYEYSGHVRPATPWIPPVLEIRNQIMSKVCQVRTDEHPTFNVCLGNLYRDGTNYISKHSDAESVHNRDSFIASVSLGSVRDFDIWDKAKKERILRIPLAHGSLLLMGKAMQDKTQHDLPKRLKIKEPRINLTFRHFPIKDSVK